MRMPDRRYSIDEAAEVLGCSRWTLRDRVSRSEVPHHRRGRVKGVYFTETDLNEILESQARPAANSSAAPNPGRRPSVALSDIPAEFEVLRRQR